MQTRRMVGANDYAASRLRRVLTRSERRLWDSLRNRQLNGHKFRRQHPVGRFVLDFYCAESGIAIEIDGAVHSSVDRAAADLDRQQLLEEHGIRFVRVPTTDVEERLDQVPQTIALACDDSPSPRARGEGAGG